MNSQKNEKNERDQEMVSSVHMILALPVTTCTSSTLKTFHTQVLNTYTYNECVNVLHDVVVGILNEIFL